MAFHLFPKIPYELRLDIWELAMEPREVRLSFIRRHPKRPSETQEHSSALVRPPQPLTPSIKLEVVAPRVTLLLVCKESRAALGRFYPVLPYTPMTHNDLPFPAHLDLLSFEQPVRFNRHLDTLRLSCYACSPVDMIFGNKLVGIQPREGPHSTTQWPPQPLAPAYIQQSAPPCPLIAPWYQGLTHLALHERVFLVMQYTWRSKPAQDNSPPTWTCLANWLLSDIEPDAGRHTPSTRRALGTRTLDVMLYRAEKDRASDCTPFRAQNEARVRYRTVRFAKFPRPALTGGQDIVLQEHRDLMTNNAVIFSRDVLCPDLLPRDYADLAVFELIDNENEARALTNMDTGPAALALKKMWITFGKYYRNHYDLYCKLKGRYPFKPFDPWDTNHWGGNMQWLTAWTAERSLREGFPVHGVCLKRFGFGTATGR